MIMIIISNKFFYFFFLLMALTSQQSLINPRNLRDLWLVMSILFVLARGHYLMQKEKKLVVCFSCSIRNTYELLCQKRKRH